MLKVGCAFSYLGDRNELANWRFSFTGLKEKASYACCIQSLKTTFSLEYLVLLKFFDIQMQQVMCGHR